MKNHWDFQNSVMKFYIVLSFGFFLWKDKETNGEPFQPFFAINLTTFLKNIANMIINGKVSDSRVKLEPMFQEFFDSEYSKMKNRSFFSNFEIGAHFLSSEMDSLATMIKNNWTFPLENRIKNVLKLRGYNKDTRLAYDMVKTIFNDFDGWDPLLPKEKNKPQEKRIFTDDEIHMIIGIRNTMGLENEKFTEKWFQNNNNIHHAINIHLTLLKLIDEIPEEARKVPMKRGFKIITMFPLIPKRTIAHGHIQVSSIHLKTHLNGFFEKQLSIKLAKRWSTNDKSIEIPSDKNLWLLFFGLQSMKELKKICGVTSKYTFADSIKTDGTYISLLFVDKSCQDDLPKYEQRKRKKTFIDDQEIDLFDHDRNISKRTLKLDQINMLSKEQLETRDWIGIDPGRNDLLHCYNYNTEESFHLSKLQYRSDSGITKNNKWWDNYFKRNFIALEDGTQQSLRKFTSQLPSFKTIDFEEYKANLEFKWKYNDQLWELLCPTKRRALKFAVYGNKKKVVDQFYQKMVQGCKNPPVFCFGDASFASNAKGELSGPTKMLLRAAQNHAPVLKVNEYFTSQKCFYCVSNGCDCPQDEIKLAHPKREKLLKETKKEKMERKDKEEPYVPKYGKKELHNVVWCQTNSKHNYMKRDLNSAKNIVWIALQTLLTGQRPESFCAIQKDQNDLTKKTPLKSSLFKKAKANPKTI